MNDALLQLLVIVSGVPCQMRQEVQLLVMEDLPASQNQSSDNAISTGHHLNC